MGGKWIEGWETKLAEMEIESGGHKTRFQGVCVMEAVAWLRDQEHSDRPTCVSPVIGAFLRAWNDGLPNNAERNRLLKPLLPLVVDTADDRDLERSYMALDWLVRVHCPAFLGLTDSLKAHAVALSGLSKISDAASLMVAKPLLDAAGAAAWAAARDAARDAAGDAAWAAAGDAAWAAARDAARDAAWAAAWAAAGAALKPTVTTLQDGAADLVRRMAAVGK